MSAPAYDLLLVAHVIVACVGFGAIAIGGLAASSARRSGDPVNDASVRRFFTPGRDWPARAIFLVPVIGGWLLFGGDHPDIGNLFPWIGLAIWVIAAGIASGVCWPAERAAQVALGELVGVPADMAELVGVPADVPELVGVPADMAELVAEFRASCRRMEVATGAISVCFVAALAVMIVQP